MSRFFVCLRFSKVALSVDRAIQPLSWLDTRRFGCLQDLFTLAAKGNQTGISTVWIFM